MLDTYCFYGDRFLSSSVCLSPVVRRIKGCCNLLTVACCSSFMASFYSFSSLFVLFYVSAFGVNKDVYRPINSS